MNDLAAAGLLGVLNSDGELVRVGETWGTVAGFRADLGGMDLTTLQLTALGHLLYRLMQLELIPTEELTRIA